jgi:2,4-dienoyl-CoA reductase (NADPH2)
MFQYLFSPIVINKTEVKNRIAYPSLGLLYSMDGRLNDRYTNFYRERALGGAGIVTVGPVGFSIVGSGPVALQLGSNDRIMDFARVVKAIHDGGARAWIQLFHAGAYSYSKKMGGPDPVAPSAVYSNYSKLVPREMSVDEIASTQQEFVDAALRAREAGFDGVEIIGSAGYLITQFLSPLKNLRTDRYGGSFENRIRFARELIEMMRKSLGQDYPLSIRMAGNDFVTGSNTDSETPRIAREYEKSGIDLINVTGGWHESHIPQLPMELPRGALSYLALNIKRSVSVPVMASNRITDPWTAEELIRDDIADMVNLGRVLIADPEWPLKAMEGRDDEIRPCIACSQGCTDRLFSAQPVACLANARAGFEGERNIAPAAKPKRVMVIGAGPGGLEAAIRAAEAGHEVELYEKNEDIGGQLWIAGTPPNKQEIWDLIHYYDTMLEKFEVDVILEKDVDPDFIRERNPDYVIVAEGAAPVIPRIKGMEGDGVLSAWNVLREDPRLGKRVAVIGGGAVGLETAMFVASKGTLSPEALHFLFMYDAESVDRLRELTLKGNKEVTVFEMLPKVGSGVGRSTRWVLLGNVERYGITTITGARVLSIDNGAITYEHEGATRQMQFNTVINAVGSRSVRNIADSMEGLGIPYSVIGDSVRPAQIIDAIHEAFLAVMKMSESC